MATLEQLYQQVLGRPADPEGYAYWSREFGPTVEPDEVSRFLSGIVSGPDLANRAVAEQRAQQFVSNLNAPPPAPVAPPPPAPVAPPPPPPPPPAAPPPPAPVTPVSSDRSFAENLVRQTFQTVLGRQPLQEGLDYWTNEILSGRSNPSSIALNVYYGAQEGDKDAAEQWRQRTVGELGGSLESTPLETTGESRIDPAIAPYLTEALGVARNLFLSGTGPELYPGQMYVSPSEQTLQALTQAERIATSPEAQALSTQGLQAYQGALGGLSSMARGDYLQSPEYQRYLESVTRPVTEQVTQQILPSIASQYSAAGRYGSGAMQQATGKATELGTRALGDITAQVAQQQQGRMLEAQTSLPSFLGSMPQVLGGALAPSTALAGVGAQREAIAGQPLQEAMRRFEYGQQLPYSQLSGYLSSVYGSPLGNLAQPQGAQTNQLGQVLGGGILGSQLGSLFGGFGGYTGGQIGAGLGALGGLLL